MLPKVKLYGATDNVAQMSGPAVDVAKELAVFFKDVKANETLVDGSKIFDPVVHSEVVLCNRSIDRYR